MALHIDSYGTGNRMAAVPRLSESHNALSLFLYGSLIISTSAPFSSSSSSSDSGSGGIIDSN